MPKKLIQEEFITRAKVIHGNKYDYSKVEYINNRTKVCIICPEHGEFWQVPCAHLMDQGCPVCRYIKSTKKIREKQGLTTEQFIEKARKIHGNKYDYSKVNYVNTGTKVCIICPEHGEFWQTPHHHLGGSGCPECGRNDISEKKLYDILNTKFNNVISQYKPNFLNTLGKPQSIDIFFPDINLGIEYQGRQHFVPISKFGGKNGFIRTVERDTRKYNLCKENNLSLIYFSYENKNDIPDIYLDTIYTDENEIIEIINKKYNDRH